MPAETLQAELLGRLAADHEFDPRVSQVLQPELTQRLCCAKQLYADKPCQISAKIAPTPTAPIDKTTTVDVNHRISRASAHTRW